MYRNEFQIEIKTTKIKSTAIAHELQTFTDGDITINYGSTPNSLIFKIKSNNKNLNDCRSFLEEQNIEIL